MKTIPITVIAKINVETPKITAQPQSGTVGQNTWRELFVEAETSDNGTLTYQWFSNDTASNTGGAAIDGATRANLTVPTEELGTKHYYVVITNTIPNNGDGGTKTASVTSAVATITVSEVINAEEPVITVQPQNATINAGTAHSLSVTATSPDSGTLTYQWYSSKVADLEEIENEDDVAEIDGATSATYSPPTNTTGTYYYFVLVTNEITDNGDGGQKSASFISEIVTLTINETTSFIKVTTPTISANGSNPSASRTITLASEAGAIIYYTIDGSTPTIESLKYTAPFTLNFQSVGTSHTVRAIAVKENMANSDAAIQVFTRTQNNAGGGGGGGGGATTPPTEPTNPSSGITIINITVEAGGTLNIGGVHNTFINNISVPMLQIKVPASVTGNQSVSIGSDFAGQNAVLVKLNASTNELEFVSVSTVGTNGNANMNIAQAGEYFALTFKTGDVTGTGEVQTADALALLRHIAGISELNSVQLFVANGKEGDVGTNDALNILRLVAGIIEKI
ncbi:MAG: chitobiase/beta-hexosaminidase C-terminal domain-containing protein [Oscillospiraceae bacterium]|nr:chitobiase/beta-hexosaminidase C-terminal domain-containing protein [Oscillospiraceae bacterium]